MKKGALGLGIAEMLELFKHGGSMDYAGEFEARGDGREGQAQGQGGRRGVLESGRGPRQPVKRGESAVFGRRW